MMNKHFLDTSVALPILFGTNIYREYFKKILGNDSLYISQFVQMEFMRGQIANMIEFYFVLNMPTIKGIDEALILWSNKFQTRKHKAIERFIAQIIKTQALDYSQPRNKEKALLAIARVIRRMEQLFRKSFKNTGIDSARCSRAKVVFKIDLKTATADFQQFIETLNDTETHRSKCRVDDFILNRYRAETEVFVKQAAKSSENKKQEFKGFEEITQNLRNIIQRGESACSCTMCERIGDAIIALDTPRDMQLEHTDASFDYLCPAIKQPHKKHLSEIAIHKNLNA